MINYDDVTGENKTKQNWPYIPEYPFRILIIWGSGQEKRRHYLFNLIKRIWLYDCYD